MSNATVHILTRLTGSTTADVVSLDIAKDSALRLIDSTRQVAKDTQIHETADRDGTRVCVFYTQLAGPWDDVDDTTHVVSIPTAELPPPLPARHRAF
ncbi:hypothetical protein [Streptomyces sp. NPDC047981]|uniref:hypothetical protein n=1 Tax=Streptomyces sp. NPDC047981 TaxID=3154610 RepID=UPI00341A4A4B